MLFLIIKSSMNFLSTTIKSLLWRNWCVLLLVCLLWSLRLMLYVLYLRVVLLLMRYLVVLWRCLYRLRGFGLLSGAPFFVSTSLAQASLQASCPLQSLHSSL